MVNIQEIVQDTLVNYNNHRFADAARSFQYLMHSNEQEIDKLYFAYRALDAYKRSATSHDVDILRVWQEIGISAFQQLAQEYEKSVETSDKKNTVVEYLLQTIDRTIELLQQNRKKIIEVNLSEVNEISDAQKRISLLEKFLAVKVQS